MSLFSPDKTSFQKEKKKNTPPKCIDVSSSAYNMSLFSSDKSKSSESKQIPTTVSTALPISGMCSPGTPPYYHQALMIMMQQYGPNSINLLCGSNPQLTTPAAGSSMTAGSSLPVM